MAGTAGHKSAIEIDNAAGTLVDLSVYFESISGFEFVQAMLDDGNFASGNVEKIGGLKNGAVISASGKWHATPHAQFIAIAALTTGATQTVRYSPAGKSSGSPYVEVETLLASYTPPSDHSGRITMDVQLQMTGAITTGSHA